jgi:8-amino-7-oxononanoate synthase
MERIVSPTEGIVEGRLTILAGTNNYLGLTFDPACVEAGRKAIRQQGTGTTGSRMANGSFSAHEALEKELADFYQVPYGMVFSTGYAANLGTLVALLKPGDAVLLDADAHASLYDGCQMSGADIYRFRHNDVENLEKRLRRLADRAQDSLIITEGLYSVLGDCAPLVEIVELKKQYGALLLVDEAHSLGVYGDRGCGVAEAQGVMNQVDFFVGTFSKSLGAMGGFCVSPHAELDLIRYVSRPFIFTASSSPSIIASTHEALRQLKARPELRETLWRNARLLYQGFKTHGFEIGPDVSPVIAVRLGEKEFALTFWNRLLEQGVYTNLMIPPASPDRHSYIRCSISAAHTAEQVEQIIDAFASLKKQI